jgi:rhodanese-related sulfurtransferase
MTGADLERRIRAGDAPVVVDVRSGFEFRRGHVPGAYHVPFWTLPFGARRIRAACARSVDPSGAQPAPSERPVVMYCGLGPRAWYAGAWLRAVGFAGVERLDGHMVRWRRERRPLDTSANDPE